MSELTNELTVLLHESDQVTGLIERSQTTANTLFGAVLPAAGALVLFAAKGDEIHFPPEFLGVFFAAVVTLALVFNAGLWLEITRYTRYKYLVLFPRIYKAANLRGKESLGQFLSVEHLKQRDFLSPLFQLIVLGVMVTVSSWAVAVHTCNSTLRILLFFVIAFLATSAVAANFFLGQQVRKTFREISGQAPLG